MIQIHDSMGLDEDQDINKEILTFIRLREISQFSQMFQNKFNYCDGLCYKKKKPFMLTDQDFEPMDTSSSSEISSDSESELDTDMSESDSNNNQSGPWYTVWNRISLYQNEIKRDDIEGYLENYTNILRLHLKHNICLDIKCFTTLLNCIEPSLMDKFFNANLITRSDRPHLACMYERQSLFNSLQPGLYTSNSTEPIKLILSLAILLYKTKCTNQKLCIMECILKKLTVFINRQQYEEKFRTEAIKHFVKCVYLNGIFTRQNLTKFLASTERSSNPNRQNNQDNSDNDQWPVDSEESDSDSDSEDSEDSDAGRIRIPLIGNQANRAQNVQAPEIKSVGDLIGLKEKEASRLSFPLSLKNLARIEIKNVIKDFSPNGVDKLYILPNVLRRFVLFQEEINAILKLSGDEAQSAPDNSANENIRIAV